MFSKVPRVSGSSSSSPSPSDRNTLSPSISSPNQQLLFELQQAVDRDMVFTRSQDNTPMGGTAKKRSASGSGSDRNSGKRKAQHEDETATPSAPAMKKPRVVIPVKKPMPSMPKAIEGEPLANAEQVNEKDRDSQAISTKGGKPAPSDVAPVGLEEPGESHSEELSRLSPAINDENASMSKLAMAVAAEDSAKPTASLLTNSPKVKPADAQSPQLSRKKTHPERVNKSPKPEKPTKATHERFGSEEPDIPAPEHQEIEYTKDAASASENEDSDDEAPETVTASAGEIQARTAAQEEAKATSALREQKKRRRQEQDARLKEQAKAAKKSSKPKSAPKTTITDVVDEDKDLGRSSPPRNHKKSKTPLPTFLPEHILAEEPSPRPSLSLTSTTITPAKSQANQKRKILDLEDMPPKDIKKGNVKVRVLPDTGGALPPKASLVGKALRERWLMGVRGNMGKGGVERRGFQKGGFVRR